MNKSLSKIFSLDGPWGQAPGGGSNKPGGPINPESIDDLLKDLKNKYSKDSTDIKRS